MTDCNKISSKNADNEKSLSKSSVSIKTYVLSLCLIFLIFIGWLYVFGGPYSQMYGLKATATWLKLKKNKWNDLKKEYPDLKSVELTTSTAANGCLVVIISEPISNEARLKLYRFMLSCDVNRPIRIYDYKSSKEKLKQHPKLSVYRKIEVPEKYKYGKSHYIGMSDYKRYLYAYEQAYWRCIDDRAKNIDYRHKSEDLIGNGWPPAIEGCRDGYLAANKHINSLIKQYGKSIVQKHLRKITGFEFKNIKSSQDDT